MAPASNEEQFKFLISCIRYSNNGKVDFQEVADECNIVSKGAAAKRYERMMKAHGIHQSSSTIRDTPISSPRPKASPGASSTTPKLSSKKRKADLFSETNTNTDDDEGLDKVKAEPTHKKIKSEKFKDGATGKDDTLLPQTSPMGSSTKYAMGLDGADDGSLFSDFLSFGALDGKHDGLKGSFPSLESDVTATMDNALMKAAIAKDEGQVVPESILITD